MAFGPFEVTLNPSCVPFVAVGHVPFRLQKGVPATSQVRGPPPGRLNVMSYASVGLIQIASSTRYLGGATTNLHGTSLSGLGLPGVSVTVMFVAISVSSHPS